MNQDEVLKELARIHAGQAVMEAKMDMLLLRLDPKLSKEFLVAHGNAVFNSVFPKIWAALQNPEPGDDSRWRWHAE